ncbi:MAG: FKBP-type peptidyl-prolyl cis-trans isomerase [Gammaproteobacteria bacterium]
MKLSRLHGLASAILAVSVATAVFAQGEMSPKQKGSYSIGVNIGSSLASQGLKEDLDVPTLVQGLQDAVAGGKMKMSEDDMKKALEQLSTTMQTRAAAQQAVVEKAGKDFLAKNSKEAGVKTTASGLQYSVVSKGKDAKATKPKVSDTVKVHYEGKLVNGTVFDSSIQRGEPITFPLAGVIPGWTEGVQLMNVGDKFHFVIPSELAYGAQGAGPIPPNSVLIFDVELLGIEAPAAPAADGAAKKK